VLSCSRAIERRNVGGTSGAESEHGHKFTPLLRDLFSPNPRPLSFFLTVTDRPKEDAQAG